MKDRRKSLEKLGVFIPSSSISHCCNKHYEKIKGFSFMKLSEYNNLTDENKNKLKIKYFEKDVI